MILPSRRGIWIVLAGTIGCSTDTAPDWRVRALTFNAALAPGFEPRSHQRLPALLSALRAASQSLDVLCVQEFWVDSHFRQLTDATAVSLPYVVHPPPRPSRGTCGPRELATLAGCAKSACRANDSETQVGCIQSQCASEVRSLSGGCLGCLVNHLTDFGACTPEGDSAASGDPAIFDGDFDTGLLSRYQVTDSDVLPLLSYFQRGAVLYARIEVPQLGPVHAFCTHLSSALGSIPYAGAAKSWEDEHLGEVMQLVSFIHSKAGATQPVLLLGDLNTGLASVGVSAVLPAHFQTLLGSGLKEPDWDSGQAPCSECSDNTWRAADTNNARVDHVLIARFPNASARVSRAFTEPVLVPAASPAGEASLMNLSDHYGLRLELSGLGGGS